VALVSVIVPAFDAARYIRQTLESVCAQTYRAIEVLVVDDGSRDATRAIVEEFAVKDSRVRLMVQPNAGVGAARNAGIRQAKGLYIAPIDADDVWHPRKLEAQVACMESHGLGTGLVYCWSNLIDPEGRFLRHCGRMELEGDVAADLIQGNFINSASVPLFRAAALAKVGPYLTRSEQAGSQGVEDWDLSLRIAERYQVHFAPAHLAAYRQTDGLSLSTQTMIQSLDVVHRRILQRNPATRASSLRRGRSGFYHWLGARCYVAGRFATCCSLLLRAACLNPGFLRDENVGRLLAKSAVRMVVGRSPGDRPDRSKASETSISAMFPPSFPEVPRSTRSKSVFVRGGPKRLVPKERRS
jgi:cellulose synthase/poly-beta-1,6-N-acetylglucosamine synthase-like glycosyltransferase